MRSLVEVLLRISKERVRAQFIIGTKTIESLESFVIGYSNATVEAKESDFRYEAFSKWLRARGDVPQLGWSAQMRKEANDDSELAVDVFLDRVEKFVAEGG